MGRQYAANRIRELRKKIGLTQEDIAAVLVISIMGMLAFAVVREDLLRCAAGTQDVGSGSPPP